MSDSAVLTTAIPHGVVFLYDPTSIVEVPADTAAGPVLSAKGCISIWTLHEVDGVVELSFADQISDAGLRIIFKGLLETPGSTLAFNTSAFEPLIEVPVVTQSTALSIFSHDLRNPSKVVFIVELA